MVVAEVHVAVGDMLNYDDKVIVLETGKVALDIPSPHQGIVAEVFVKVGDSLQSGADPVHPGAKLVTVV